MNSKSSRPAFILTFMFMLICLCKIETVVCGIKRALSICALSIIPSLFLFMILSDIIVSLLLYDNTSALNPKVLLFCIGALCGFPIGAALCERLCKNGIISSEDAAKIVPLCNNTSPAFVIGAIGVSMLGNKQLGLLIYLSQLAASLILLIPIKINKRSENRIFENGTMSEMFFSAVEKAVGGILKVCALICIFTVAVSLLGIYVNGTSLALLSAIIEIGSGSSYSTALFNNSPLVSVALCGFACGWSGICVHMQILSALKVVKVKYSSIILSKSAQGLLCALFSAVGYYLFFT